MSQSLATRGYISPTNASVATGATGFRVPFELRDTDGNLVDSVDLSGAGVVQISQNGAAYVNRVGAAPTFIGDGAYYYTLDASEVGTNPWVLLKIEHASYPKFSVRENLRVLSQTELDAAVTTVANDITAAQNAINANTNGIPGEVWNQVRASHVTAGTFGEGVVVNSVAIGAANAVRDAFLDYSHRPGRTVRGWIRRMDAVVAGRATGLRSALARFFQPDGVTEEVSAAQSPSAGTREVPDVTSSEVP